jgi:hypothetical protein
MMSSFKSPEDAANVPDYTPPPLKKHYSGDLVRLWIETAYEAWPDLPMERIVETLSRRLSYSWNTSEGHSLDSGGPFS